MDTNYTAPQLTEVGEFGTDTHGDIYGGFWDAVVYFA
ncbi:lasso RiPP family leader peptide-containing protein [Saccharopolyspora cebuensis]|uniref:Lasso RiPP family leader peptide-containing protein n=1 Tax=Saccharopolyspora cebuensis TaxID=418759 RepID=A0ABV4CQL1_9PSEU